MKIFYLIIFSNLILELFSKSVYENIMHKNYIPNSFIYLSDVDSTIIQDIRNAKNYNILGKSLIGYETPECILTNEAAKNLSRAQKELKRFAESTKSFLTLRVFDCYRPRIANDQLFYSLIQSKIRHKKINFHPNLNDAEIIKLNLIEKDSAFSRGSTVAVTLSNNVLQPIFKPNEEILSVDCVGKYDNRFMFDFGIDMGTNYECLDKKSFYNYSLPYSQQSNRKLLKVIMENNGFTKVSPLNWWEFTLTNEPYNETSFNFSIKERKIKETGYCPFKQGSSVLDNIFDLDWIQNIIL